jgi:hypothetical protein
MLTCVSCGATSGGAAWHWIALLHPVPGGAETVCYCPSCAEAKFQYFSRRAHSFEEREESLDE